MSVLEPPIFWFLLYFMALLPFFFFSQIDTVDSRVSLPGQYILLYVCLLATAPGSRRLRPKGFPQHPGTSCLAEAAPVVRMEKAYARTRAAVTWDGYWLRDLIFGCNGPPLNSAH